ncbi:hypothetical protein [Rhodococcus sp. As11]|uniref:hypothetical protein n=1 Tax=Rhodococcus sp. As11 TaxID=3029189 RepID=UPI003B80EC2A
MDYLPDGEHRRRLFAALRASGLGVEELWLRYFALGGEVGKVEVEAYLNGLLPLPHLQHDLIAHAINERLDEIAPPRAPYSAELPASPPKRTVRATRTIPRAAPMRTPGTTISTKVQEDHEARDSIPAGEAGRTTYTETLSPEQGNGAAGSGIA